MIRIDEIYQNTFLPWAETQPLHGLHWFDPFGSVQFEDLRSVPPVPGHDSAVRYLFWDQEPLHEDTVAATLPKFKQMFSGRHHIITSEKNSAMVEYVKNTYDITPHYYFFHGWAALDWYRGYDRSLLITPPSKRTIRQTFIAPNRIIAGRRQHRLLMLYHIFKNNLINNWISCPAVCPEENIAVADVVRPLSNIYPDIESVFARQTLPRDFPGETGHPMRSCWLDLFRESADCLLYLVTETVATGQRLHLTEKTFKPICLKMPFVIVGTRGSLAYLRSYGFRTFDSIWDESYDDEPNDTLRIERIASLLRSLDELSEAGKQDLFDQCRDVVEHNYQHFYSGAFEEILWTELQEMLSEF